MNSRPSGSVTWAAQKRLRPLGIGLNVLVVGSQTRSELSAASNPSKTTILPFESVAMWTGTSGHVCGGLNWPNRSGPGAGGASVTTDFAMSAVISAAVSTRR
jgi:hypothetical protein